jgi:hypothetical protein
LVEHGNKFLGLSDGTIAFPVTYHKKLAGLDTRSGRICAIIMTIVASSKTKTSGVFEEDLSRCGMKSEGIVVDDSFTCSYREATLVAEDTIEREACMMAK